MRYFSPLTAPITGLYPLSHFPGQVKSGDYPLTFCLTPGVHFTNGTVTVAYNFKVKGEVLTRNGETPAGSQPVTEGKVKGNSISFKTEINGHVIEHEGTISGDTMQLKNFGPGGEFDFTLKRVLSAKKSGRR